MSRRPSSREAAPKLPEGFRYRPELIGPAEEEALLAHVRGLPFREFEFHGCTGRRRTVSFGWRYDFTGGGLQKADRIPDFLLALREAAAAFADLVPDEFRHALVTEYGPGAGIGWHRDKSVFGETVGVSLLSGCVLRLRRKVGERRVGAGEGRGRAALGLPAGGSGAGAVGAGIPPVDALRYSVTFRNLRKG